MVLFLGFIARNSPEYVVSVFALALFLALKLARRR
jgi:hypothetical protein